MIGGGPPWAGQSLLSQGRRRAAGDLSGIAGLGTWWRADHGHTATTELGLITAQTALFGGHATTSCQAYYYPARSNGRAIARPALRFGSAMATRQITNYAPVLGDCTLLAVLDGGNANSLSGYGRVLDKDPNTGPWISGGQMSGQWLGWGGGFGNGDEGPNFGTYVPVDTGPLTALMLVREGGVTRFYNLLTSVTTPLWTGTPSNALSSSAPFVVGANQGGGQRGDFYLYDWAVWPRALALADRQAALNYVTGRYQP